MLVSKCSALIPAIWLECAGDVIRIEQGARSSDPKGKDFSDIVKLADSIWAFGCVVIVHAPAIQQHKLRMKIINLTAVKIPI